MFSVTPVPENRERKVSFSPDIDESYRHQVVDKIKNLMEEVQTIHEKEEKHLKKHQDNESWEFKQKQELELQAFLKKQREDASSFQNHQVHTWNNLKEKQTQETWRLFGKPAQPSRPTISNLWDQNLLLQVAEAVLGPRNLLPMTLLQVGPNKILGRRQMEPKKTNRSFNILEH
eukprot:TRINITY_DN27799_c0_g1_i1.p2 TRINITY_DN27799_c0_g1~~TRINITY_DN27799_c0_g1_i1.p2  ORF type:complete len:174 (-),score=29.23 TRINITY_DN27799_c0_g1_i1:197-718(-)